VNTNLEKTKLLRIMKPAHEVRRAQLSKWVAKNGVPPAEKSYFSQLLSGDASFGEKAARRLEDDYGMGTGYLDRVDDTAQVLSLKKKPEVPSADPAVIADEIIELISLYQQASDRGRKFILDSARGAAKASQARWIRATNDET
jgi:hypothetical protein